VRHYLIAGNQTLAINRLAEKVQDVLAAGPAEIHIVVPATPTHEHFTWTERAAHEIAEATSKLPQDQAIVVLKTRFGEPVTPPMLNHAYRRFIQSGASRGVELSSGFMPFLDVRPREFLDPALLHAGPELIASLR
jgi:hypothetical protein